MNPGELYLDVLFPLAIRRSAKVVIAPPEHECTLLLLSPDGPARAIGGEIREEIPGDYQVESGFLWLPAHGPIRIIASHTIWALVMGRRLLDQLVISTFGEPGFSRFLDSLSGSRTVESALESVESMDNLCLRLSDELDERRPAFRTHARAILSELLLILYRAGLAASTDATASGYRLSEIIDYIESSYSEDLSLTHLAKRAGYSPSHFSRLFSGEVGMPLSEYINRARVRKACMLLRRDDRSVSDIAFDVGYNNISFFNRYFRKLMNMSPREYRKYIRQ